MRLTLASFALALCAAVLPVSAQAVIKHYQLNIARQPLDGALKDFARQTGLQIARFSDAIDGSALVGPVNGELSAEQALDHLLLASGLSYKVVNDRTIAVIRPGEAARASTEKPIARSNDAPARASNDVDAPKQGWFTRLRLAQATPNPSSDSSSSASTASESTRTEQSAAQRTALEEITVTATRREESIRDVPLSISAFSADDIDRRGLVSGEDYLRSVPGVSQVADGGRGSAIVIRGIETSPTDQNFSAGTTVATYFGETPTTNSAGSGGGSGVDPKLVDIERIEVLRGPQGTSFGDSSLGGAVRVIPAAPNLQEAGGKVAANYSSTAGNGSGNNMIQGVANIPLVEDKLAIRAVGYRFQESGIYRNVAGDDAAFQAFAQSQGAGAFAVNRDEVGEQRFTGGRVAALWQANDAMKLTFTYFHQKTEEDGQPYAQGDSFNQSLFAVAPENAIRGEEAGAADTDIDLANVMLEYDFGWAGLVASVSRVESGSNWALSFPDFAGSSQTVSDHAGTHAEVRLATQLEGAWNFLGGLYSEEMEDTFLQNFYWLGTPDLNPFGSEVLFGIYDDRRKLKQNALFAEASYKFLNVFTFTAGGRAYQYDRDGSVATTGGLFGVSNNAFDTDSSGNSLKANLSYKPTDDAMYYAGWSQGFRLGRPTAGLPPGTCDRNGDGIVDGTNGTTNVTIASTRVIESDDLDNFEIGVKWQFLDRRLFVDAAVYRIEWTGLPVRVATPGLDEGGCAQAYVANAGEAKSEGFELQVSYRLTEAMRIDAGGSTVDAVLTKDAPALGASKGARLPGSPKVNANLGLEYQFGIAGREARVRADSFYVGKFYGELQEDPGTQAGGYVRADASARVTLDRLNVELFVHNLTNEDEYTWRGISPSIPSRGYRLRPRTVGIQLGYDF